MLGWEAIVGAEIERREKGGAGVGMPWLGPRSRGGRREAPVSGCHGWDRDREGAGGASSGAGWGPRCTQGCRREAERKAESLASGPRPGGVTVGMPSRGAGMGDGRLEKLGIVGIGVAIIGGWETKSAERREKGDLLSLVWEARRPRAKGGQAREPVGRSGGAGGEAPSSSVRRGLRAGGPRAGRRGHRWSRLGCREQGMGCWERGGQDLPMHVATFPRTWLSQPCACTSHARRHLPMRKVLSAMRGVSGAKGLASGERGCRVEASLGGHASGVRGRSGCTGVGDGGRDEIGAESRVSGAGSRCRRGSRERAQHRRREAERREASVVVVARWKAA